MINVSLLKKQILDLAFSGKLTEHKSNESSNDLINMLFKNKQKKYASFSHELVNFEIPPNWNWCMTYQAVSLDNGTESEGELLPYLEVKYLRTGKEPKIINSGVIVDKGEKLILVDGENSGEVFLANNRGYKGSTMKILNISNAFIDKYIFLFIYSCKEGFRKNKTGAAIPHLDKKRLFETPLPIPPLQEQKRIVEKLDEIFAELDKIDEKQTRLATIQEKMEAKILKLAIQGKLVEQRPEEGTGEELFKLIQQEKQELIKQGKIKKEKPLPAIEEDEIPFEIPSTWKWVRLKDICTKIVDGDHNPPAGIGKKTDYLMVSAININNDSLSELNRVRYLTKDVFDIENQRTKLSKGDILLTIVGTMGRSCIYDGKLNLSFQRSVSVITTPTLNFYLKKVFDSQYIQRFMEANSTGTAQKGFYLNQVEKLLIPIPPLDEQKRIVAKIEELLPLCRGN